MREVHVVSPACWKPATGHYGRATGLRIKPRQRRLRSGTSVGRCVELFRNRLQEGGAYCVFRVAYLDVLQNTQYAIGDTHAGYR